MEIENLKCPTFPLCRHGSTLKYAIRGVEVHLHLFFTPTVEGGVWYTSHSYHFFFLSGIYNPCEFEPPHSCGFEITHNDTPQSVGLLWTSDQPITETCTWQTHNTKNRHTFMPPAGFEPAIPADDRLQTHALDRSATGIGTPITIPTEKNQGSHWIHHYWTLMLP